MQMEVVTPQADFRIYLSYCGWLIFEGHKQSDYVAHRWVEASFRSWLSIPSEILSISVLYRRAPPCFDRRISKIIMQRRPLHRIQTK
eukprot:9476139-Pyramimonas_sp.AAC.2